MTRRRALLFGIDKYGDPKLVIPAAARDVKDLSEALTRVGFPKDNITSATASLGHSLTTNSLRRELKRFLTDARKDDELLVYYSGHGVEWDGHRLLIPQDYYLEDPRPRSELLGDQDLYTLARASPARSVLFVIDACREGIKLTVAPDPAAHKGLPDDVRPSSSPAVDAPTIAIVYSCGRGEVSHFHGGAEGYSYFTRRYVMFSTPRTAAPC